MKEALQVITDGYNRRARLYPALVCIAPAIVTCMAILGVTLSAVQSIAGVIISCGGTYLLSQLARDAGKRREKELYERWGGMPSMAIFRHRHPRLDAITKARYHKKLGALLKTHVPTRADEERDAQSTDEIYAAWSNYLRVNTRDTKLYSLLFQELVQYGYRRNLWGLRSIGITICTLSICSAAGWSLLGWYRTIGWHPESAAAGAFGCILLVLWIGWFTPDWVRVPAEEYAARLAEATDTLQTKASAAKSGSGD